MEIKTAMHSKTGVMVRSDGFVLIPANYHYPEHWTEGTIDTSTGYRVVMVKHKNYYVHRLMAEAFIPNEEGLRCVDHINRNRSDNRLENLRWASHNMNCENSSSVINRADYGARFCEDRKTYNHNYHLANKDAIHARQREYRLAHKDEINARVRAYRQSRRNAT